MTETILSFKWASDLIDEQYPDDIDHPDSPSSISAKLLLFAAVPGTTDPMRLTSDMVIQSSLYSPWHGTCGTTNSGHHLRASRGQGVSQDLLKVAQAFAQLLEQLGQM